MGSYSDHKRTYRANRSHRSLDWQRNDRLGRATCGEPKYPHWCEILRTIRRAKSDPNCDTNSDSDSDGNGYRDSNSYTMRGKMCTYAETASNCATASVTYASENKTHCSIQL